MVPSERAVIDSSRLVEVSDVTIRLQTVQRMWDGYLMMCLLPFCPKAVNKFDSIPSSVVSPPWPYL